MRAERPLRSARSVALTSAALAALALVGLAAASPAARADALDPLAKQTGIPVEVLRNAGAEKLLSKDVYDRRGFLEKIGESPREDLLPLVIHLAEHDPDWPVRLTAVKLISVFGLLADRDEVARLLLPLLERNMVEAESQLLRWSIDETIDLNRWFRFDTRLAPALTRHFEGEDFNLRALAFRGICHLEHPGLVEELTLPACWNIYESNKSSLFDRRAAIATLVRHEVREVIPKLQWNLRRDGRVAVISGYGLAKLLDPSSLKELRRIDHTAVHRLRMVCWWARTLLDDQRCLKEALKIADNRNEHDEIKRTFVADLGNLTSERETVRKVLLALQQHRNDAVKLGAAMGLLKLDDASGIDLVVSTLKGPWEDSQALGRRGNGWMLQLRYMDSLLRIEQPAADPAIVAMIDVSPDDEDAYDKDGKAVYEEWWRHGSVRSETLTDWYDEYRAEAVSLCGERKIEGALERLKELSKGTWGHFRFHAIVSRIELGDERALRDLKWFLPRYDDRFYRSQRAIMGKVEVWSKRMKWSSVFDVCEKFERMQEPAVHLPILEELLKTENDRDDPMAEGWAKKHASGAPVVAGGAAEGGSTTARGGTRAAGEGRRESGDPHPLYRPPEVPYRLRHQFARRRAVECAARIAGAKAAPILGRALRDSRAIVRATALIEIGRLSGLYELFPGDPPPREQEVWPAAVGWLAKQGAWPE